MIARDIQVLKTYGAAPYAAALKKLEKQIKEKQQSVNEKIGVKVCAQILIFFLSNPDHHPGIRHRSGATPFMGCRRRPTTNVRRTAPTSRTMHEDHPGREEPREEQIRDQCQANRQICCQSRGT